MLYLIGLGLADEKDITVKGLEVVKKASRVFLEAYTAVLLINQEKLESYYGRPIIIADREMVESSSDTILQNADTEDIAFLVVGDPFSATTHTDLLLRARHLGIRTQSIPNASILTAVGATGLSLYTFGQTVSIVFFTENWRPSSFYDKIAENATLGLHTLLLLDIKVKEPDLEKLARGKIVYEAPRYMSVSQCCTQLLEIEVERKQDVCGRNRLAVGIARAGGGEEQNIVAGTVEELAQVDLGKPLHSVVLCGRRMHEMEWEFVREWAVDRDKFDNIWRKDYASKS
ncbi:MAG: diphthine synthase [Bogoriella megaspora]|nr:MAG: diphthine synthase [Bogoriella megaspora]